MEFLTDVLVRLFSKTPYFFKIVRTIGIVLATITGLPIFLTEVGINLPDAWDMVTNKIVAYASLVAAFVAQLAKEEEEEEVSK
jgi:hypothetical protein